MHSENQAGTGNGEHFARYSDGKSAAARDASLRLDLSGLEITLPSGERFRWPYEGLQSSEPLRPYSVDVLLTSKDAEGRTLFVPGVTFVRELATRAPHLTIKARRWRHARPWLLTTAVVAAAIGAIVFTGWSPAQSVARLLPESWRERLGEAAIRSMAEDRKRCTNAVGIAALERLSSRLSLAAGPGRKFRIAVVDWSLLNAFAVPGNQIIVTRELVEKAESPDEVAGVIAHEMGHGLELHPETGIIRAIGMSAAVELMLGGSGGTLANLGLVLAQLGYTRAAEREADQRAIELLRKAEISNEGLKNFFKRVSAEEGDYGGSGGEQPKDDGEKPKSDDGGRKTSAKSSPLDLLRTHPPTAERAELLRSQPPYPATPALDPSSWRDLKSICSVTTPAP